MTEGFLSFLIRIPETNSLVVFLCNSSPTDFFGITRSLLSALYNKPVQLKQPLHKLMASTIIKKGTSAAIAAYDELKKDTARYYADCWNIDQLGHQLFNMERYNEALLIFEKNAKEFPQRDLVFISLGQTYEILGRRADALAAYKKAVTVNPDNEEAKNRLKQLEK